MCNPSQRTPVRCTPLDPHHPTGTACALSIHADGRLSHHGHPRRAEQTPPCFPLMLPVLFGTALPFGDFYVRDLSGRGVKWMKTKCLVSSEELRPVGTLLSRLCLLIPCILWIPHFSAGTSLFWLLWVFSPPAIISACRGCRCYLHLRSPPLSNAHCSGASSWGDLYNRKKIKQNGRDRASPRLWACNSSAAIRCLQNVAETLQKKNINNQPQSLVAFWGKGVGVSLRPARLKQY